MIDLYALIRFTGPMTLTSAQWQALQQELVQTGMVRELWRVSENLPSDMPAHGPMKLNNVGTPKEWLWGIRVELQRPIPGRGVSLDQFLSQRMNNVAGERGLDIAGLSFSQRYRVLVQSDVREAAREVWGISNPTQISVPFLLADAASWEAYRAASESWD